MPTEQTAVEIDARPESVFALLVEDRTEFSGNEVLIWERVGDYPMGVGYSYKSTFLHRRHRCEMHTRVTRFESPWVLKEEWVHHCEVANRSSRGSLRYALIANGDGTTLIATKTRRVAGFAGWIAGLLGGSSNMRSNLELFASRVEARVDAASGTGGGTPSPNAGA